MENQIVDLISEADLLLSRAQCLVDPEGDDLYKMCALSNSLSLLAIARTVRDEHLNVSHVSASEVIWEN
ncbi:hypothetical protein SAMN04488581_3624 [Mycolicibacterium neoaurum]|nr:hypothetical protein SAMN04488581_3624 [Mycolicibacterium neoaurum]